MNDLNNVFIIGRLTRDAELSFINTGTAVCKFSIANNQSKKKDDKWIDEAHFFDVTLWSKTGEALAPYLKKGKQIAIEGRLTQDRWTDTEGKARSRVQIVATSVQLLGGGKQNEQKESDREPGEDNEPAKTEPQPGTDEIPF
jgi:single-strand DNA-binding protein